MTDKEIVERAKEAEKSTCFGELVRSPMSRGVNSAYGIGFIEGMVEYRNSLQEEPISEDLNTAAKEYANNITDKLGYRLQLRRAVCFGAKWQITKLVEEAGKHEVKVDAGGYPYIPQIELYDYYKDVPLAKEGDKYNVILIKED